MHSSRLAAALLLLIAVTLAIANGYETLRRSTIPLAMGGTVIATEVRHEKHPGVDDVHLIQTGKDSYHVDASVAERLNRGDRIEKDAWSKTLLVNSEEVELGVSQDLKRMLIVMPLLLVLLVVLLSTKRSSRTPGSLAPHPSNRLGP